MSTNDDNDLVGVMDDEPMTYAIVTRLTSNEIRRLKQYMQNNNVTIIYQTVSYGPLYISKNKHED